MKKLFVILLALMAVSASAQSVQLYVDGQPLDPEATVDLPVTVGDTAELYVEYANISPKNLWLRVKREDVQFVDGDVIEFCVGGSCNAYTSVDFELLAGETVHISDTLKVLHITYVSNSEGSSRVKFSFVNDDTQVTEGCFYLHTFTPNGVPSITSRSVVSAYPNPATTSVNISYRTEDPDAVLVVRNLLGTELYRQPVSGKGIANVSLADFPAGVYVYGVMEKGKTTSFKKLIVK